jgi:hypothetical protein
VEAGTLFGFTLIHPTSVASSWSETALCWTARRASDARQVDKRLSTRGWTPVTDARQRGGYSDRSGRRRDDRGATRGQMPAPRRCDARCGCGGRRSSIVSRNSEIGTFSRSGPNPQGVARSPSRTCPRWVLPERLGRLDSGGLSRGLRVGSPPPVIRVGRVAPQPRDVRLIDHALPSESVDAW